MCTRSWLSEWFDGMEIVDWTPMYRPSVKALVAFRLPGGIVINNCAYCARGNWRVVYPAQSLKQTAAGSSPYERLIKFEDAATEAAFQRAALAAIDRYLSALHTPLSPNGGANG